MAGIEVQTGELMKDAKAIIECSSPIERMLNYFFNIYWTSRKKKIAGDILLCFKDLDLSNNTFFIQGKPITDKHGDDAFYRASQLDIAFDRLNKLIDRLRR